MMVAAFVSGCGAWSSSTSGNLETVDRVDIERYMGTWYEIARYPNTFEQGCSGVTAEYTLLDNGRVRVVNICRESDGRRVKRAIEGFAMVADRSTNAKLMVYFFFPFGAPYWILDLDEDYRYAVVGEPTRQFLWVLSRTPTLDAQTYHGILQRLSEKGYDPTRLEITPQPDGGLQ